MDDQYVTLAGTTLPHQTRAEIKAHRILAYPHSGAQHAALAGYQSAVIDEALREVKVIADRIGNGPGALEMLAQLTNDLITAQQVYALVTERGL